MDTSQCVQIDETCWEIPAKGPMRVPAILRADLQLLQDMDQKVYFDISCGVRTLHTGLDMAELSLHKQTLAYTLYRTVPAGVGSKGRIHYNHDSMHAMSRSKATKQWQGKTLVEELAAQGIIIRSPSMRGVAEEAPAAYKDVSAVVDVADKSGLAGKVARLEPVICVKG